MKFNAKNKAIEYLQKRQLYISNEKTLIFWNENFYIWRDNFWNKTSFDEIRDDISLLSFDDEDFLDDCKSYHITDIARALRGFCKKKDLVPNTFIGTSLPVNTHYISMKNGILKIAYNESHFHYEIIGHTPLFFNLNILPYNFTPEAKCEKFESFIYDLLSPDEVQLLLEWLGYNLIPVNYAQKFMIYFGAGANGKGVISSIQKQLLGDLNYSSLTLNDITGHDRFKKSALENKLANITDEIDKLRSQKAGMLKLIVGGGTLFVEDKGETPRPISPYSRLTFSTNTLPQFDDQSDGPLRRVLILFFKKQFLDEKRQNKSLMDKNYWNDQLSGIFNLSLLALGRLIQNNWQFTQPLSSQDCLNHYKQAASPAFQFLKDYLELSPDGEISTTDLYQGYSQYCKIYGYRSENVEVFGKYVRQAFPTISVTPNALWRNGRRTRLWKGIKRTENTVTIRDLPAMTQLTLENITAQKNRGNGAV